MSSRSKDSSSDSSSPEPSESSEPSDAGGSGELDPSEKRELSNLAAQWKRDLAPHYQRKKRRELVKTRTIKFSRQTLDLLDILSLEFKTTDADIVRAMCSYHRISYSTQEETIGALMRLISRFAGAFDSDNENSPEHVRLIAREMLRQATEIYRAYEAGKRPDAFPKDLDLSQ